MKKDEFNSMIRLYFVSIPDDLGDDLCLVKGALIIVQKLNSEWAYGYHIKNQGGGTVGEYHLIFKSSEYDKENECVEWESAFGDFRNYDMSTADGLKGFNEDEALEMFGKLDDLWDSTLHWGGDLVYTTDEVEEYSGYDEMFLCYKSKFSNLVEENSSFWYAKDNANWDEEVFLQHLDIESVSEEIPGNMCFWE
ncbi:MAG: hypothetical protein P8L20_08855 [Flavobacteriales bacterium]|nr:hypothetical protein [Flavobacteriales bacterium]